MERESLLAILIVLLSGTVLQLFAGWPGRIDKEASSHQIERLRWFVLWWPVAPPLTVAAWLCGWALSQPDPVPAQVGAKIFVAVVPFVIVGARAVARAAWSLLRSQRTYGIATVGVLQPRIVVAAELVQALDERALLAALAHERAHLRHRDPLRIWLAQFVTDLQWPWGSARNRFTDWLAALERARDDEARAGGVDGADLAAAVLGSVRFQLSLNGDGATLIGRREELPARIERLLQPLPVMTPCGETPRFLIAGGLGAVLLTAVALGTLCGERPIASLLAISY